MAATIDSYRGTLHAAAPPSPDFPISTIGPDDTRLFHADLSALLTAFRCTTRGRPPRTDDPFTHLEPGRMLTARDLVAYGLLEQPTGPLAAHLLPPPSYEETLSDLPPDYTASDCLVTRHDLRDAKLVPCQRAPATTQPRPAALSLLPALDVKLDLSLPDNVRTHAKKKAKQAAKQAQQAKWADSDNEEKNDDGTAGDGQGDGGDGTGGAGAGGDGGGGGDGGEGGGDDDEWWKEGAGGKKPKEKKKKKKNAWYVSIPACSSSGCEHCFNVSRAHFPPN